MAKRQATDSFSEASDQKKRLKLGDLSIKIFPEIKESEKLFKVVKNTKRLIEKEIKLLNGVAGGDHA